MRPKVLIVILLASLALNIFLGGLIVGRLSGAAFGEFRGNRALAVLLDALPADKRDLARAELRRAMPEVRRHFQAIARVRAEMREDFMRPQLDEARLDRQYAQIREHTSALQSALQSAYKRTVVSLTPEERRAVVDALARSLRRALPDP